MTDPPSVDDHEAYRAHCEWLGVPYVPGFVQRQPLWMEAFTFCPGCMYQFHPPRVPKKSGTCPACGDRFWIRKCPDGIRRTLNETAMIEVECLQAERGDYLNMIMVEAFPADMPAEVIEAERAEAKRTIRGIARGRVLAKHGRG